jgi:hypothetical protein
VLDSDNGEMPLVWHRQEEAHKWCRYQNKQFQLSGVPYGVFKVHVTVVEEVKDDREET